MYNSRTLFKNRQTNDKKQYKKVVQYQVQTGTRAVAVFLWLPEIVFLGQKYMQCDWRWPAGRVKITEPIAHHEGHRGLWGLLMMYT